MENVALLKNYLWIWPGFNVLRLWRDSLVCLGIAEDEEALFPGWVSWHCCPCSSISWLHVLGPWLQSYMSQFRRHCLFLKSLMKVILSKRRKSWHLENIQSEREKSCPCLPATPLCWERSTKTHSFVLGAETEWAFSSFGTEVCGWEWNTWRVGP